MKIGSSRFGSRTSAGLTFALVAGLSGWPACLARAAAPEKADKAAKAEKPEKAEAAAPADKAAAAEKAAQEAAAAEKLYRDVYGPQHDAVAASKDKAEKVKFGKELMEAAKAADGDAALQQKLWRNAALFAAADAAGWPTALEALRKLPTDGPDGAAALAQLADLLEKMLKTAKADAKTELATELVDVLGKLAKAKAGAHDYEGAAKAVASAKSVVRMQLKSNKDMLAALDAEEKSLEGVKAAGTRFNRALAVLKASPDDPAANTDVGLFYLLTEDDEAKAAPYLAKSEEAALKKLGEVLKATPDNDAAVADALRTAAAAAKAKDVQKALYAKAAALYRGVLEKTPDHPDALKIKLLLTQIPGGMPAETTVAKNDTADPKADPAKPDTKGKTPATKGKRPAGGAGSIGTPESPGEGWGRTAGYTAQYAPEQGYLIIFRDNFRLKVGDRFLSKTTSDETWEGHAIEIWRCALYDYHHILNTNWVKAVRH